MNAKKRLLIYLWLIFDKNEQLVVKELAENNLHANRSVIDAYFEEHNINEDDYSVFWENGYTKMVDTLV